MAIQRSLHYNAKELLLYIAIILTAEGTLRLQTDVSLGLLLLGGALIVVFARGAYKKFLDSPEDEELPIDEVITPQKPPEGGLPV